MIPVPGAWVTLHRVGTDRAGPLDSTRTSASGRYAFTYRRFGVSEAIYFVSSSRDGVAYIGKPLTPGTTTGDDATIVVYDTTSRPVPVTVRGRHVVVSAPGPGGERAVTEVFDLSNDSSVTRVAADDSPQSAVWSVILPEHARDPAVTDGDVAAQGVKFVAGRVFVYAPFAPGLKQLAYSYTLPGGAFPLSLPVSSASSVLEVLVQEPSARVTGVRLRAMPPVVVQGRQFLRYLASDVPANAVISVDVARGDTPVNTWYVAGLTVVLGGVMTAALARAVRRR